MICTEKLAGKLFV